MKSKFSKFKMLILFRFARRQIIYLNKYKEFSKNKGAFDSEQANVSSFKDEAI